GASIMTIKPVFASFAKLVYVSSWMKCHHPAVFACALLNSQPMGFYAPAQIVRDARENGVTVRAIDVGHSDWDCTLEDGLALRLGLRQVDGLQQDAMERVMAARPFRDVDDLRTRAHLDRRQMKILAEADALGSLGQTRRDGMWSVMGHLDGAAAPVFDVAAATPQGPDRAVDLPKMPKAEEVVADYQTTRLSLKGHPMSFFRNSLQTQGYACASELWGMGHGRRVKLAGLVLVRQKPGSAKGVCFITLEDETGVANLVIWPDKFEAMRGVIMSSRLMSVTGQVQTDGKVLHVVVQHIENRTDALDHLADVELPAITVRGDHPTHPISNQVRSMPGQRTHPRDVRVIPKSRDFH
ncbi:MAG: OB-fold nucleic acid binding domain-containing protein, partial [Pseudomonadota bacterium]